MTNPPPMDERREAVRVLYLDGRRSVAGLAALAGVSPTTIRRWANNGGWQQGSAKADEQALAAADVAAKPASGVVVQDRAAFGGGQANRSTPSRSKASRRGRPRNLVRRLYRVIDHNVSVLESRMDEDGADPVAAPERDMRALGTIVRSMEKLKDIETGHGKAKSEKPRAGRAPATVEEEDRLRMRIVERILKLRERRGGSGGAG